MNFISYRKFSSLFLALFLSLGFYSCTSDDDDDSNKTNNSNTIQAALDETLENWYYWLDELKSSDIKNYSTYNEYFDSRLSDKDKWSYIADLNSLRNFLNNGTYKGHGISFEFNADDDFRVSLVFNESNYFKSGITRGWKVLEINDNKIADLDDKSITSEIKSETLKIKFQSPDGLNEKTVSSELSEINQNTVLKKSIINHGGKKIAYLAFNSFLGSSKDELNDAFNYFSNETPEALILDLRYNGGGSVDIANQLASLITGNDFEGKVFGNYIHNEKKQDLNKALNFGKETSAFKFSKIYVITTSATASASELVINGLKPHMGEENIVLIGSKTHGKPVGMYVFENEALNLAIVPITFSIKNSNMEGDFFNGIPVNHEVKDDLTHDFGSENELCIAKAIELISGGTTSMVYKSTPLITRKLKRNKGLDQLINAY
ncbi:MAG: S41 family peptidase [Marinifilaceae bacterium]|jgi:C-terminal processing protease CtpA/Prc|nr:S41 family peptidase [Marinifilaceae bacterium]